MKNLLDKIFKDSTDKFLAEEAENIINGVTERNLCGRLAIYLTDKLRKNKILNYYADTKYNRKQNGRVKTILDDELNVITIQCYLIVHSRGNNIQQDNLIAVEMKKSSRPELEKVNDRKRLRALTKENYDEIWSYDGVTLPEHVCGYILGIYMILDIAKQTCYFEYYQKGQKVGYRTQSF